MIRCDRASVEQGGQLVLEAVSLHVRPGEAWAVIGVSGAGKSMLVAAAATVVPLHGGDILVDGRSVRRESEGVRRAAGYVPDRPPEWPGLRASEFLELFAVAAGLRGRALAQAVEKGLVLAALAGRGATISTRSTPAGSSGCYWPGRSSTIRRYCCSTILSGGSIRPAGRRSSG